MSALCANKEQKWGRGEEGMRRLGTSQGGPVCGLEKWGLGPPCCVTMDISVRACGWGMSTPNGMAVEEGGGLISPVTPAAPSSQHMLSG